VREEAQTQRLFSAFPAGLPGGGLLVLRLAAGMTAIVEGLSLFAAPDGVAGAGGLTGAIAVAAGLAMIVGLFAPLAGLLIVAVGAGVGAAVIVQAASLPARHPLNNLPAAVLLTAIALALVLLGPGALSIDSYLFGRREIVIPADHRTPDAG
jgi:uncharacterized membrane protein YphA (DoxX/SURF4 family)